MESSEETKQETNPLFVKPASEKEAEEGKNKTLSNSRENGHEENGKTNDPYDPKPKMTSLLASKRKRCPLLEGCNSIDNYIHLNKIHEGAYGVVFRAKEKSTDEIYAIKKVKSEREKEGFPITSIREINLLLSLKHPYIVNVREVVIGSSLDKIYVVMEYIEHELKDLMDHKNCRFTQPQVKLLMKQLLQAIEYLHSRFIIHRDLKTSNILYSNKGFLKVCDFGLARKYVSSNKSYTPVVVTLWYRAPEVLLGCDKYTPAIDIWSVGCIFAELVLGEPLLRGQKEGEQIDLIFKMMGTPTNATWPGWKELKLAKPITFKNYVGDKLSEKFPKPGALSELGIEAPLSEMGLDLLKQMLTLNPDQRITAAKALKHSWFEEVPISDPATMPTFAATNEIAREFRKTQTQEAGLS